MNEEISPRSNRSLNEAVGELQSLCGLNPKNGKRKIFKKN